MHERYVSTVVVIYSVLSGITALMLFVLALALTFLSPFAVTLLIQHAPESIPPQLTATAFAQLATGLAVIAGVVVFALAAFFLALMVGLWRRELWAKRLVLVPCVFWLFSFPIGTVVGIYGIYAFAFDKQMQKAFGLKTKKR